MERVSAGYWYLVSPQTVRSFSAHEKADWLTTVTARVGYAANNWLFYVKGGGGWHDQAICDRHNGRHIRRHFRHQRRVGGWRGHEYGFTPNWTGKVEYQHLGLENATTAGPFVGENINLSRHFDMVTVGVNYKF
jgi:opacity protein-like surface antigen